MIVAETILKNLGINKSGTYSEDGSFVVDIDSSDEFGKIFSILEDSDLLIPQEDNGILTDESANMNYLYEDEDFLISLSGDLENDIYQMTITEI
jgi:hypothetical protein